MFVHGAMQQAIVAAKNADQISEVVVEFVEPRWSGGIGTPSVER
jgi:hypothetical protein